jgi:YHS domain-containing protein
MKKHIFILLVSFFGISISAQTAAKRLKEYNLDTKVALQGYDPVAYFKGKPAKGAKEISATFDGALYHFASIANRDSFLKKPMSYEPQYGGWCAYAMGSSGDKVDIDPETFKIIDGKLYLFYNAYFNNTLKSWNKDEMNLKKKADANWKKISN